MIASNRLKRAGASLKAINPHPSNGLPILLPCLYPRRTAVMDYFRPKKKQNIIDPLDPKFLKRKPPTGFSQESTPEERPQQGDLAPSSIFNESENQKESTPKNAREQKRRLQPSARDPAVLAAALDPSREVRRRWLRRKVVQEVRSRGQLTKAERIARTERESLCKSQFYKTSIKKLMPLARQIAGKPIEEAIIQMRFSKKRVAADVKKHLEYARDEAIVKRGMGLGTAQQETNPTSAEDADGATAEDGEQSQQPLGMVVEDKKGKRRFVSDMSSIYVDEAWIGRGTYGTDYDFRARGRTNILRPPETSITVRLKEEATRVRLMKEREEKRQRRKVWVALPDRPVTAQRQYPLW